MRSNQEEVTWYQCENCGEEWKVTAAIGICVFCGKELCQSCSVELEEDSLIDNFLFDFLKIDKNNYQELVCKDCYYGLSTELTTILGRVARGYFNENRKRNIQRPL